jgi:hypothetical protein
MQINIRAKLKPLGRKDLTIDIHETNPFRDFMIGKQRFLFTPGEPRITAMVTIEGDEELLKYYQDTEKLIPRNPALESHRDELYAGAQQVFRYLKYFYGIPELDENLHLSGGFEWSPDELIWNTLPEKHEIRWLPGGLRYTLDDNLLFWIPKLAERNIQPFFAFTHLHTAFSEKNTRHQWINATIAAELAFKEFLSQFDSRATTLITQVPSPPLQKLYRDVLKDYTGEESPVHSKLNKGAEKRNALIHRTTEPSPTPQEALIYSHQVEVAIFHLYSKLYQGDPFFEYLINQAKGRLDYVEKNAAKLV